MPKYPIVINNNNNNKNQNPGNENKKMKICLSKYIKVTHLFSNVELLCWSFNVYSKSPLFKFEDYKLFSGVTMFRKQMFFHISILESLIRLWKPLIF